MSKPQKLSLVFGPLLLLSTLIQSIGIDNFWTGFFAGFFSMATLVVAINLSYKAGVKNSCLEKVEND